MGWWERGKGEKARSGWMEVEALAKPTEESTKPGNQMEEREAFLEFDYFCKSRECHGSHHAVMAKYFCCSL